MDLEPKHRAAHRVPLQALGVVGSGALVVGHAVRLDLEALRRAWETPW